MNPLASFSGGGGLSASSSATATSGDAFGKAGTSLPDRQLRNVRKSAKSTAKSSLPDRQLRKE